MCLRPWGPGERRQGGLRNGAALATDMSSELLLNARSGEEEEEEEERLLLVGLTALPGGLSCAATYRLWSGWTLIPKLDDPLRNANLHSRAQKELSTVGADLDFTNHVQLLYDGDVILGPRSAPNPVCSAPGMRQP